MSESASDINNINFNFGNIQFIFTNIILIFAVWIFINTLLIFFFQSTASSNTPKIFADKLFAKNTFVILLLILSIYLCVASIVAIPEFQALESSAFNNEELTEFAKEVDQQTGYLKEDLLIKEISLDDLKLKKSRDTYKNLNYEIVSYNQMMNMIWKDLEIRKKFAVEAYKSAFLEKTASRERIKYSSQLKNWVRDRSSIISYALYQKPKFEVIARGVIIAVSKVENDSLFKQNKMSVDSLYKTIKNSINEWEENLKFLETWVFSIQNLKVNIPDKPEIGEEYGIFRSMSGWLLRTESMSLALIVGLFAFGLLGSIGSTFIRQRIKTGIDTDIINFIPNLPAALINGISSAIVIFLAVKGMLIIFSGKDSGVNAYMLFFTCLVAAVFSEDVWKWAQNKLNEELNNKNKIQQDGENGNPISIKKTKD